MVKAHKPILWQNSPSVQTPINEKNLNQMDSEIGVLDNRIITLDMSKANTTELGDCLVSVVYESKTGRLIFLKKNGSSLPINTGLNQVVLNLGFDEKTQEFILYLSDGSTKRINVSAFIANNEFLESETITWQLLDNGKVIANIKNNSIKGYMLEPNYLANVMSYSEQAELSAEEAEDSAIRAEEAAEKATAAVGGDFATNTKVDNIINGTTPVAKATDADTVGGKHASDFLSSKGGTVNGELVTGNNRIVTRHLDGYGENGINDLHINYTNPNAQIYAYSGGTSGTVIHTGNKPKGTYTGNGDAAERTVNTGGIGRCILINSTVYFAFVTPLGAIYARYNEADSAKSLPASEVKYSNGILTIASTRTVINNDGAQYSYQVI